MSNPLYDRLFGVHAGRDTVFLHLPDGCTISHAAFLARAAEGLARRGKTLVVVFQRGAVDGLNVVVPHGDPRYYDARRSIAVARKDVADLDGFFGLHPAERQQIADQPVHPLRLIVHDA